MSGRAAALLAWSLAGLSLTMFVASIALDLLARSAQSSGRWAMVGAVSDMLVFVPFLAFPTVRGFGHTEPASTPGVVLW